MVGWWFEPLLGTTCSSPKLSPLSDMWLIKGRSCSIYPCSIHTGFWGGFYWKVVVLETFGCSSTPSFPTFQLRCGTSPMQGLNPDSHISHSCLHFSALGAVSTYTKTPGCVFEEQSPSKAGVAMLSCLSLSGSPVSCLSAVDNCGCSAFEDHSTEEALPSEGSAHRNDNFVYLTF